jgi:hypothetical protein
LAGQGWTLVGTMKCVVLCVRKAILCQADYQSFVIRIVEWILLVQMGKSYYTW